MKKKGFTIIELMSIIVILGIIVLIAVPVYHGIIGTIRKDTFNKSVLGLLKSADIYYTDNYGGKIDVGNTEFNCNNNKCVSSNGEELDYDGDLGHGKVTIDEDGNVSLEITDDKYCAYKYANNEKIYIVDGNCDENNIDIVHDMISPTITMQTITSTSDSIRIGYNIVENESEIKNITCMYGENENSINQPATSETQNACVIKNLQDGKKYYYKVCATDNGLNETKPCLTGEVETGKIQKPTVVWQGYNTTSAISNSVNGYVYKDVATVTFIDTNISSGKAKHYVRTSAATTTESISAVACGTGTTPSCEDNTANDITTLAANTWYQVTESTLNLTFTAAGNVEAYTYDASNNEGYGSGTSRSMDRTGPTLTLTVPNGTTASVSKTATVTISDNVGLKNNPIKIYYAWSTSSVSCSSMTKYITITPTSGAKDATGTITILNNSNYGNGKLYICNKSTTINDMLENKINSNTSRSENMYLQAPLSVSLMDTGIEYNSITVRATASVPSGTTITKYEFKIGNGSYTNNGTTRTKTFSGLSRTTSYTIYVRVTDSAGNTATDYITRTTMNRCEDEDCTTEYREECTTKYREECSTPSCETYTDSSCISSCDSAQTSCEDGCCNVGPLGEDGCDDSCLTSCSDDWDSCAESCERVMCNSSCSNVPYEECEDVPYESCDTYYYSC